MNNLILTFLITTFLSKAVLANKCQDLFKNNQQVRTNSELRKKLRKVLSTSNQEFNPKASYARLFADAILDFVPTEDNFIEAVHFFKNIRISIAEKNINDADLLNVLNGETSRLHFLGLNQNSANATSIYPDHGSYAELSRRYTDLYQLLESSFKQEPFAYPSINELTNRLQQQLKSKVNDNDPRRTWRLHYEELDDTGKMYLIGGVVRVESYGETLYAVYNSFSKDIPKIIRRMEALWKKAINSNDKREQLQLVAEIERFFFWSNPWSRAAASIGDAISLALQVKLGLSLRDEFVHLDFYALSMSKNDYIKWRFKQSLNK